MTGILPTFDLVKRWTGASQSVVSAIQSASKRTGVSFDYLMNKAQQESSFNPTAKAGTSSATGLYQFIESTWLSAVREYGAQFGLGHLSAKISSDGKVSDTATKQQILSLRNDPEVASNMVAAMTKDNAKHLENSLGGTVGETDLYMAHFLGLGGAEKFLKAKQDNQFQAAADLFPAAAKANKNVFYEQSGKKRSLDDVYDFFAGKMDDNGGKVIDAVNSGRSVNRNVALVSVPSSHAVNTVMATPGASISAQLSALNAIEWGHRQMLESVLSGLNNFGAGTSQNADNRVVVGNNLLSPYTAYIMAKLQTPDDVGKVAENL